MKKNISVVIFLLLLTGCTQHINPQEKTTVNPILSKVTFPDYDIEAKANMGDYVVYTTLVSTLKTDTITLGNASGAMSEVKKGNYCHIGGGVYQNFEDIDAVGLKSIAGQVVTRTNKVKYDKKKNNKSLPNMTTFDSTEISIKYTPNMVCNVSEQIIQSILFNGKSGNDLNFIYSESYPSLTAKKIEFSVPLSDAKIKVEYKNLVFKVLRVEGTTIHYTVLQTAN